MPSTGAPRLLQAPALLHVNGLAHAVTTRHGGASRAPFDSLNVGLGTEDDPGTVTENRRRVAHAVGFDSLTTPYQVHGRDVIRLDAPTEERPRADALVTTAPGVLLGVLGADCPGVLIVDEPHHVLAVAHAGWRGVAAGVIDAVFDEIETIGGRSDAPRVWIGPAIGIDRYEVRDEVVDAVRASLPGDCDMEREGILRSARPGHAYLSLADAIRCQIGQRARTPIIDVCRRCTYDDEAFFSYRRDGARTGRHALVAGWKS